MTMNEGVSARNKLGFDIRDITHHILFVPQKRLAIDVTPFASEEADFNGYSGWRITPSSKKDTKVIEEYLSGKAKPIDFDAVAEEMKRTGKIIGVGVPFCRGFEYLVYNEPKYQSVISAMEQLKAVRWAFWKKEEKKKRAITSLEKACRSTGLIDSQ